MINVKEHFYSDDPEDGHPDVKTRLKDGYYYFTGNGKMMAAIQISPCGEGSEYGLLLMNPDEFGKKRDSITFHKTTGIENTRLEIFSDKKNFNFQINDRWIFDKKPIICISHKNKEVEIQELFYPEKETCSMIREIDLISFDKKIILHFRTGIKNRFINFTSNDFNKNRIFLIYKPDYKKNEIEILVKTKINSDNIIHNLNDFISDNDILNFFYRASVHQLNSVVSSKGKVDASIWQYNREWVRDHSFIALGILYTGNYSLVKTILQRLTDKFVDDSGNTVDSSERRDPEDVELDQNGILLYAIEQYFFYSNDKEFILHNQKKIIAIAEFPLNNIFYNENVNLVKNSREFWERHSSHGIKPGYELAYNLFLTIGLKSASRLAKVFNLDYYSGRWNIYSEKIKKSILTHPLFSFIDKNRGFQKRQNPDGSFINEIYPKKGSELPESVPLSLDGKHYLNPDSSNILPIIYNLLEPDSEAANKTFIEIEKLWDPFFGGYFRYNKSSEPDSPGPWIFPTIFIARAYLKSGNYDKVMNILNWLKHIPGGNSACWFEMYGEKISPPFPQASITPWNWAELIILIHEIIGVSSDDKYFYISPHIQFFKKINYKMKFRDNILDITINKSDNIDKINIDSDIEFNIANNIIKIKKPDRDIKLKIEYPYES